MFIRFFFPTQDSVNNNFDILDSEEEEEMPQITGGGQKKRRASLSSSGGFSATGISARN